MPQDKIPPRRMKKNLQIYRLDWLWNVLAVICLLGGVVIGVDILMRFLKIGPDTLGILAVVIDVTLTAFMASEVFSKAREESFKKLIRTFKVPQQYWVFSRFMILFFFFSFMFIFQASLPRFAIYYNNRGLQKYKSGLWTSARDDYNRAIKLSPDYSEAHYNLGLLYEALTDITNARIEYQIALQGGLDAAYNNLAHLYLLDKEYSLAVPLL